MILFVCTGNIWRSAIGEALVRHYGRIAGKEIATCSAGILAWDDSPMAPSAKAALLAGLGSGDADSSEKGSAKGLGKDLEGSTELDARTELEAIVDSHKSQALTRELVEEANLVIAMTREHAQGVVSRFSPAKDYTFLAGELLRLIKALGQENDSSSDVLASKVLKGGVSKSTRDLSSWVSQLNTHRESEMSGRNRTISGTVIGRPTDQVADPLTGGDVEHSRAFAIINELANLLVENLAGN